jgi:hypothetical protein
MRIVCPLFVLTFSKRTNQIYMKCHVEGLNIKSLSELNFVLKRSGIYHSVVRDFCLLSTAVNTFNFGTEMSVDCEAQSLRRVAK